MDSVIKAHTGGAFGAGAVTTVKVQKLVIKATNADAKNNLSNFETARMVIYSDTSSVEIATIRFPTAYSDSLTVIPATDKDISGYLRSSELAYNLFWKNRRKTTRSLKLAVGITIGVQ